MSRGPGALQWNLRLLQAVEQIALEQRARIAFRYLIPNAESELCELLETHSYASSLDLPLTRLAISPDWRTFADYRRHLKTVHANMESSIRLEQNRGRRQGFCIESFDQSGPTHDLYQLLNHHAVRLNGVPLPYGENFLDRLRGSHAGHLRIFVASLEQQPVGVLIGVRAGLSIAFPLIGIDQQRGSSAAAYLNLVYNHSIQFCIEQEIRQAYFGTLAYPTKVRRGCQLIPSVLYVRGENALLRGLLPQVMELRSRRMRSKLDLASFGLSRPEERC